MFSGSVRAYGQELEREKPVMASEFEDMHWRLSQN
jgi:hypothetical protein